MRKKLVHLKKRVLPQKRISYRYLLLLLPFIAALGVFYFTLLKDLPSPTALQSDALPQSTQIYDRNNTPLYTIYADRNQTFIPLKDIPIEIQQATISIEDRNFYHHGAIDMRGILRAALANLQGESLQGGSTLTQQLVKNSLLNPERTIERKVKEVILSFATEMIYSKDQILEMYLNQVPYGGTAYGVQAAAQTYFGKNAKDLTLAESALLAGLPESPTTYSPFGSRPELARVRQEEILLAMEGEGYITSEEREKALDQKIVYREIKNPIKAPHFVFYIKDLLVQKYGIKTVEQGGLKVITSLDLDLQEYVQASVAAEIEDLEKYNVSNGAALVTNPGTGEILAMVGSKNYFDQSIDGNVNITLAKRQPGSSIKPINYAVGIMQGYSSGTMFIDKKTCFTTPGQKPYCPRNYDGTFRGPVTMRQALATSLNIPAVQMLEMNGVDAMIATASAMGISTFTEPERYGLSLTLGGGEVTMLDMSTAFGVFANGGYRMDPHPILKVIDSKGNVLEQYTPPESPMFGEKVIPAGAAYIISDILADNNARSPAFGTNSDLRIGNHYVSVKTGTTNDLKDNWTIGYTPDYLVAVWVGNSDNTPMSSVVSGVTGASPIWNTVMSHLLEGKPVKIPSRPSDVVVRSSCIPTDSPEENATCEGRTEYALKGVPEKKAGGTKKEAVWIDKATGDIAEPGKTDNVEPKEEVVYTDTLGNKYCVSCQRTQPPPTPQP